MIEEENGRCGCYANMRQRIGRIERRGAIEHRYSLLHIFFPTLVSKVIAASQIIIVCLRVLRGRDVELLLFAGRQSYVKSFDHVR